jgi:hypothetical protein
MSLKKRTKGKGVKALIDKTKPGGIKIGFVKGLGKHPGSDATIAEIAAYNEFGTRDSNNDELIPERPFLRTTIKEELHPVYLPLMEELLQLVLNGKISEAQAVGLLGEKAVADVKNKIDAISEPPNAQSTIDKKRGSTNPLVDSGLMKQSVSWERVG